MSFTALTVLMAVLTLGQALPARNFLGEPRATFRVESPHMIVGGEDSTRGKWPWQLSLQYQSIVGDSWFHTCGASLLDSTHAVTAAHCTHGRYPQLSFRIVLGAHDLSQSDHEDIINIIDVTEHEEYSEDEGGFPNDIAILTLERPATFNEFVQPIALSIPGQDWIYADCWATGWGYLDGVDQQSPDQLQEVELQTLLNPECVSAMPLGLKSGVRETNICTDDDEGVKGTCQGDSGGPLSCQEDGVWHLAGVVSWGVGYSSGDSCVTSYPSVYSRVSEYYSWIMEHTGRDGTS